MISKKKLIQREILLFPYIFTKLCVVSVYLYSVGAVTLTCDRSSLSLFFIYSKANKYKSLNT